MDYCHVRRRQEYIKKQSKKRKAKYELLANKMDEAEVRTRKFETELNQENIDYISFACNEEIPYWKNAAFTRVLNDTKEKELAGLSPSKVLLNCE